MKTRQALVLVGGRGTRLGALAAFTPKPLMAIDGDIVFLDELLFDIARQGFDDIVLLAGHFHEQFVARYADKTLHGARVRVVVEPAAAGTAGAILNAADHLAPSFLFVNGDTLFDINLRELDRILMQVPDAMGAMALRRVPDVARYGSVTVCDGRITAFHEKAHGSASSSAEGLINGGIGILRREVVTLIDKLPCSIETDIYPRMVARGVLRGAEFSGYFIDIGLPDTLAQARAELPARRSRPTVFFDRDGVLNRDAGYTYRVEDLEWIDGAIETIRLCNDMGALVLVVTNQAGIARGYYQPSDVDRFHDAMNEDLARFGAHIDGFFMCPYHPQAAIEAYRHADHPERKPNPGMILNALREWPVDPARSILVGDQETDIEAARRAGIEGLLFRSRDLRPIGRSAIERIASTKLHV